MVCVLNPRTLFVSNELSITTEIRSDASQKSLPQNCMRSGGPTKCYFIHFWYFWFIHEISHDIFKTFFPVCIRCKLNTHFQNELMDESREDGLRAILNLQRIWIGSFKAHHQFNVRACARIQSRTHLSYWTKWSNICQKTAAIPFIYLFNSCPVKWNGK